MVGARRTGVKARNGDALPVSVGTNLRRGPAVDRVAEAQLAAVVVSPAPQGVIDAGGARVVGAGVDLLPVAVSADLGWDVPFEVIPEAELAVNVPPPAPQGVIALYSAGVGVAGIDARPNRSRRAVRIDST